MVDPEGQRRLQSRPPGRALMLQRWSDLVFLHAAHDPETVRARLPEGLQLDTFPDSEGRERAWIGFVPFRMSGVRVPPFPPVPGHGDFLETNLRTYVRGPDGSPGVWFFSLEAASALACRIARASFSLPYWPAKLALTRTRDRLLFEGERRRTDVRYRGEATLDQPPIDATPGTLAFFLIERYQLFAVHRGRLHAGRVHHAPYRPVALASFEVEETLSAAAGLTQGAYCHGMYAAGVDVEVFPLRPLA